MVPDWKQTNTRPHSGLFVRRMDATGRKQQDDRLRAPDMAGRERRAVRRAHSSIQPDSGPYGGMSFVIFPTDGERCLVTLGLGTAGLQPDEGIIGRPGHARKTHAICAWLNKKHGQGKLVAWAKQDPARTDQTRSSERGRSSSQHMQTSFDRYGKELYANLRPDRRSGSHSRRSDGVRRPAVRRAAREVVAGAQEHLRSVQAQWRDHLTPEITVGREYRTPQITPLRRR